MDLGSVSILFDKLGEFDDLSMVYQLKPSKESLTLWICGVVNRTSKQELQNFFTLNSVKNQTGKNLLILVAGTVDLCFL